MSETAQKHHEINPRIIPRLCGGYLAVSPREATLRIGVTAPTKEAARLKFIESYNETKALLDGIEATSHDH